MWLNRILSTEEPSLLEELWAYFEEKYFSVGNMQYDNINIGSGSIVTAQGIIFGLFIGIIIAAGVTCYNKNRLGSFIRAIVKNQCLWPEKAMTLQELGFARNGDIKMSLRSPNKLGRVVHCLEKEQYEQRAEDARLAYVETHGNEEGFIPMPAYKIDFASDHFYIPDEEHYRAETRYDNAGSGWRAFILVVILSIFGASLLCFLLPDMLQLVDNLIGILSESDNVLN